MPARRFAPNISALYAAGGGGATPTVTAITSTSQFDGSHTILQARDASTSTFWTSGSAQTGSPTYENIFISLSAAGALRYVGQTHRSDALQNAAIGTFDLFYSDTSASGPWTAADTSCTMSGSPSGGTLGQSSSTTLAANGSHLYWRLAVKLRYDGTTLPDNVSLAELALAADTAGTQLLVGP